MLIATWIVSGLLAIAYLGSGGTKVLAPYDKLKQQQSWVEDFSPRAVKTIGALEVLGAIGLILPPLLNILPVLAPTAAFGLVLVQLVAIIIHVRRHDDPKRLPVNVILLAMALFVALSWSFWIR
ncbi:DoxX family protein [Cryobacterium sp. TMT4-31]|uniref:DoxX family protein n=1 Tax=Cryobacterium sp. TMT4-31 TaxID=1259259 RepID=UPI00106AB42D|nr:DoxX family protein [Cryobacterium sp. TMT4-31]TFC90371.1 DoxX family protein [Cryobacterium sp. TMT4-31]